MIIMIETVGSYCLCAVMISGAAIVVALTAFGVKLLYEMIRG